MNALDVFFNVDILWRTLPTLLSGLVNTILLGVTAIVCGSVIGVLVCLLRLYGPAPLRLLAIFYIDILRAMPILVVLILIYYALPFIGITFSSFAAAAIALSAVFGAYAAEVVRAGIQAVPNGQFEAAAALGLRFTTTLRLVVLPQAMRIVVPPHASNCVSIIKDTSLASVVATTDLLKQATDAQALYANPTPLIGAALIYVAILWPLVRLTSWLEQHYQRSRAR